MGLKKTDVWVNRSKTGKGFTVRIDGVLYVGAISTLKRFLDGEIMGLSLSMVIPDEAEKSR